ncbi:MAG: nucleotide sugar dehydrogenase [Hyphomonadaceae bacterium]|nr:nucleotide sugar dehydrogenase [Hyphomonadaceae bacterium]
MLSLASARIAVVGLGYVGLPLAVAFSQKWPTIGYDIAGQRIEELLSGFDRTREVDAGTLTSCSNLRFSSTSADLSGSNVFVVAVPTPIDLTKRPDMSALLRACDTVSKHLTEGAIVIFESTVYPGATEEVCVPALQRGTSLVYNRDFFCGYSPERANPGDPHHRLTSIVKITSGSTEAASDFVDALYASIIPAGTVRVGSMRVAEAAKVIENTQRDVNIALVNELAMIFNRMGLDTDDVLRAAGTKWNFLPFRPGLVGGHCIGVDPYYLTHKAREIGHHPDVILAGRRINDGMGEYVAQQVLRLMTSVGTNPVGAKVLVLGLAFKENCPDFRNSLVVDLVKHLRTFRADVDVHDPWLDREAVAQETGLSLVTAPERGSYDAVILAVAHREFVDMGGDNVRAFGKETAILYDVKSVLPRTFVDGRL